MSPLVLFQVNGGIEPERKEAFAVGIYNAFRENRFSREISLVLRPGIKGKYLNRLSSSTVVTYSEYPRITEHFFARVMCTFAPDELEDEYEKADDKMKHTYNFMPERGDRFSSLFKHKGPIFYEVVWTAFGQILRNGRPKKPRVKKEKDYDELPGHVEGFIRPTKSEREARISELETSLRKRGIIT